MINCLPSQLLQAKHLGWNPLTKAGKLLPISRKPSKVVDTVLRRPEWMPEAVRQHHTWLQHSRNPLNPLNG